MRCRSLAFLLLLGLGLGACGSAASTGAQGPASNPGSPVPTTPTTTSSDGVTSTSRVVPTASTTTVGRAALPDALLADPLVRFQADWFCQTSKTAYASAADIDSALGVRLASAGIDRAAYDTFVASLGVDDVRRAGVLQVFLQTCR